MRDKIYICKYCGKEFENGQKLGGHLTSCKLNPKYFENIEKRKKSFKHNNNNHGFDKYNSLKICYCQYCNKECKSLNSLNQHEKRCKENPNKVDSPFIEYNKNRDPINQYIKAEKLGLPKPKVSKETIEKIRKTWLGRKHKKESIKKIQNSVINKIINNTWHNNYGIKIYYNNECFDSSWEIFFVKYLDSKNIQWKRPKKFFNYNWNNSIHKYYPDIYLPEYDLYIEIKGLPTERDYEKWKQFNGNLDVYDSKDLFDLGIINTFDNRYLVNEEFRKKHINLGSIV